MADIKVDDLSSGSTDMMSGVNEISQPDSSDSSTMDSENTSKPEMDSTSSGDQSSGMDSSPADNTISSDSSTPEPDSTSTSPVGNSPSQDPMLSSVSSSPTPDVQNTMDSAKEPDTSMPDKDDLAKDSKPLESMENKVKAFKPKTGMLNFLRLVVEVLLVAIIIILVMQNRTLKTDKTNLTNQVTNLNQTAQTAARAEQQQSSVAAAVGKLLPRLATLTPTIIPLTTSSLTDQTSTLFTGATAGDDMLIYLKLQTVVVYSPSTGKVISQQLMSYTPFISTPTPVTTTTKS